MYRHEIALLHQRVQVIDLLDIPRCHFLSRIVWTVGNHSGAEPTARHARHAFTNFAESDQSNCLASDIGTQPGRLGPDPPALLHLTVKRDELFGQRNHQGKCTFRYSFFGILRHINNNNISRRCGVDIDRVNPYPVLNNPLEPDGSLYYLSCDRGVTHQQEIGIGNLFLQLDFRDILFK